MDKVAELRRALSEELSRLQSLVEHAGWTRLMEIADGQCRNREAMIYAPLENLLQLGKQEFEKGEVAGIKLFTVLPHKRIADIKQELESMPEEDEDDGTSPSPGAGGESREPGDDFEPASP